MLTSFSTSRLHSRVATCAVALVLVTACQNVPKYKKSSGKFAEWSSYEGKHFSPANGTVTAIDTKANTVTIGQGENAKVFPVTPKTRIFHEGADIQLAQLPVNQGVKYTLSEDGKQLLILWYGQRLFTYRAHGTAVQKTRAAL